MSPSLPSYASPQTATGAPAPADARNLRGVVQPGSEAPTARTSTLALLLLTVMLLFSLLGGATYFAMNDAAEWPAILGGSGSAPRETPAEALPQLPPPPPVEPVKYLDVTQDAARAINASVPFTKDPVPAATPLRLRLPALDEQRAVDCLASAGWYEAGDSLTDQQPVMQVILNRLRHAAFPKTVCGVVYQGADRHTGCQFSFTCDGSMARRAPSPAAWLRAQGLARSALSGMVYAPVGWSTHYHTDWVVPNWSANVDKVAAVRTHLFFRWRGANGQPGAFRGVHAGREPAIALLAKLSPAHGDAPPSEVAGDASTAPEAATGAETAAPTVDVDVPQAALRGNQLRAADAAANLFVLQIKSGEMSGTLALVALDMCRQAQKGCTVVGFNGTPGRVIATGMGRTSWPDRQPDFYYFVDRSRGREQVLWNCDILPRPDRSQCLPANFRAEG